MRIALAGYGGVLPVVMLDLSNETEFIPGGYIDLGYTNYEVACIGASGARGLAMDDSESRTLGGGGGGGGCHRVRGLLSGLPSVCDVVVGEPGATDGDSGGASSFNGTTCQASGGEGGEAAVEFGTGGDGGSGGLGNSVTPGGGGAPGEDGTWDGAIGGGGGGGKGGSGHFAGYVTDEAGTPSGRGSFSMADISFTGPFGPPESEVDGDNAFVNILPGMGGGTRPIPITGTLIVYGSYTGPRFRDLIGFGGVVIRLTRT